MKAKGAFEEIQIVHNLTNDTELEHKLNYSCGMWLLLIRK